MNDIANAKGGLSIILVFPYPHGRPTGLAQPAVSFAISCSIPLDLVGPELSVRDCDSVMVRAPMPEAAVQEDRDLGSCEYQICGATQLLDRTHGDPIPQTECMHCRPQRYLRLGISRLICLHAGPHA